MDRQDETGKPAVALGRRAWLGMAAVGAAWVWLPGGLARAEPAGGSGSAHDQDDLGSYPLDKLSRTVPRRGRLHCPDLEFIIYRGRVIRYAAPAKVYAGFVPRLGKLEQLAFDTATEIYGRPPRRLVHLGTYNCRRIRAYPTWLSEHALGNAIDLAGFDFPPLGRGNKLPTGVPRALRAPFAVRVARHWKERPGAAGLHTRFLHSLAARLIARRDIFRVLLGPGYPGHHNHLHLDASFFRLVEGFEALG